MSAFGTITDEHDGSVSEIIRVYRVSGGSERLFVGRDRKIWLGCGETPERFVHIANMPAAEPITKAAACRAANVAGTPARSRKHFRLIGADLKVPEHFMVLAEWCHPTITGSIRCGDIYRESKKDYAYLEVQEVHGDDYEVVDSWSHPSSY